MATPVSTADSEGAWQREIDTRGDLRSHGDDADVPVETHVLALDQHDVGVTHIVSAASIAQSAQPQPRKRGRPRVVDEHKDRLIRDIMHARGTTNARMIQDELAAKHSVVLTYEAIRKRVKAQCVQPLETSDKPTAPESIDLFEPVAVAALEDALIVTQTPTQLPSLPTTPPRYAQITRDLNLLAETVRTIVTHATEPRGSNDSVSVSSSCDDSNAFEYDDDDGHSHNSRHDSEVLVAAALDDVAVAQAIVGATHRQDAMPFVQTTAVQRTKRTSAAVPRQRAGRPRATSAALEQAITALVHARPAVSARTVQRKLSAAAPLDVSFETIRRRVRDAKTQLRAALNSSNGEQVDDSDSVEDKAPVVAQPSSLVSLLEEAGANDQQVLNRRQRKYGEYSTELREACVHKHEREGLTYATIARQLAVPHDTVRAIVRKVRTTGTVDTAPRSGRPRKTTDIVDRVIVQAVQANERCTAKMIQADLKAMYDVTVSCETVRRRVKATAALRLLTTTPPATVGGTDATLPASESVAWTVSPLRTSSALPAANVPTLLQSLSSLGVSNSNSTSDPAAFVATSGNVQTTSFHDASASGRNAASALEVRDAATHLTGAASATRKRRNDYSVDVREQCVAMHAQGHGYRRIGQQLAMPHTTVRAIVEKVHRTGSVLPAARSGRPRKTDEIIDRVILQAVQANAKCSARTIQAELESAFGVRVSCETIRRRVKDHSRTRLSDSSIAPSALLMSNSNDASDTGLESMEAPTVAELDGITVAMGLLPPPPLTPPPFLQVSQVPMMMTHSFQEQLASSATLLHHQHGHHLQLYESPFDGFTDLRLETVRTSNRWRHIDEYADEELVATMRAQRSRLTGDDAAWVDNFLREQDAWKQRNSKSIDDYSYLQKLAKFIPQNHQFSWVDMHH